MRSTALVALLWLPLTHAVDRPGALLPGNDIEQSLPRPSTPGGEVREPRAVIQAPSAAPSTQGAPELQRMLQLHAIEIAGGDHYPLETWQPLLTPLTRRPIRVAELVEAAKQITARYQQDGYFLSFAYVPEQTFANGVARLVLVEGRLAEMKIEGDAGVHRERLERLVAGLKQQQPLRRDDFERAVLLMTRLPGLHLDAYMVPPTTTDGGATLRLVGRTQRLTVGADADLRDGDNRALFNAGLSSLLGWGESLNFAYLYPPGDDRERYQAWNYSQWLNDDGWQLALEHSRYHAEPDDNLRVDGLEFERRRENQRSGMALSVPLLLTQRWQWDLNLRGYTVDDQNRYALIGAPLLIEEDSQLRVAAVETSLQQREERRQRSLALGVYRGLDAFGASSDAGVDVDFTRVVATVLQQDVLAESWLGVASGSGQWSHGNLPQSEQIAYGGASFGRGYPTGQASGDKGWALAYEVNRTWNGEGVWLNQVQPYAVLESARTWYARDGFPKSRLTSAALGLRLSDRRHYIVSAEVAKPLADRAVDSDDRSPRLNFTVSYQFP